MRISAALLCCLLGASAVLGACSKAGKCQRGEPGCACKTNSIDSCNVGSSCVDGMCVGGSTGSSGSGGGGKGSSAGTGAGGNDAGKTDAGKTDAGKTDAGKTDAGKTDAGKTDAGSVTCTGSSFQAACIAFCNVFCDNESQLCESSTCKAGQCDPGGDLYNVCGDTCGTDTTCVQGLCTSESKRTCEGFGFKDSNNVFQAACFLNDPSCVLNPDYGCSDTCGSLSSGAGGDLAHNGQCEDGGDKSTASSCPRGTDCTDCGPRTCSMKGGSCMNHGDCCGFYASKSLCVSIGGAGMCLDTCDTAAPSCASGESCLAANSNKQHVCAPSSAH
ncbi:MAG: hypothetical protein ACHQ53_11740 [Polyangiales bacterium]